MSEQPRVVNEVGLCDDLEGKEGVLVEGLREMWN